MVWNPNPRLHKALVWLLGISFILVPVVATTQIFTAAPNAYAAGSPTINTQPLPQNPALNSTFTLTVLASSTDGGSLSYRWYSRATTSDSAVPLSDISGKRSGTNTSTLTIANAASSDAGLYSVVVTNTSNGQSASTISNEVSVYVGLQGDPFTGSSLVSPSSWTMSYTAYPECLTAASGALQSGGGNVNTSSMSGCNTSATTALDTPGQGALRLVTNATYQSAFALYNQARNTTNGLDITFYESMWNGGGTYNGGRPADGFSVFLKDGNDADTNPGPSGGSLGYSATRYGNSGISNALFGVGFDTFGNFVGHDQGGSDCIGNTIDPVSQQSANQGQFQYISGITRNGVTTYETETYYASGDGNNGNQIIVRGPQGQTQGTGYCIISPHPENPDTANIGSTSFNTRAKGAHLMRITVDPSYFATPYIKVYVDGILTTTVAAPLAYKDSSTFKFGFSSSTGANYQNVDIWSLSINTFDGQSPPDPPSNVSVTAVPNSGGSETVSWTAPNSWGSSETGTGFRSYVAKLYDAYGSVYQNISCATLSTSCVLSNIPAGNYTVIVSATNKANITSIGSTITSSASFLISQLTNYVNGPCISQATSNQYIDTFTVPNYCVLRFLSPNPPAWYAPSGVNSLNYLIVGGGGAGGQNRGGGGGGGGFETGTMIVSTPQHTITVGAGGVASYGNPNIASSVLNNGGWSGIDNETVTGGGAGGGGGANSDTGIAGGSGGGGGFSYSNYSWGGGNALSYPAAQSGFSRSTSVQGHNGAASGPVSTYNRYTGGGGGAHSAGITGSGGTNYAVGGITPDGGSGETSTITGAAVVYGGGGGGSSGIGQTELGGLYTSTRGGHGGAGGGADGADSNTAVTPLNATDGLGGGGGGGNGSATGGNGGKGVVILRWIPIPTINPLSNVSAYVGRTVSFTVSDSSTLSHTYQWQQGDGNGGWTNIAGATGQTLSIPAITLSMNGNVYRAIVTDTDGVISSFGYSSPALLAVSSFTTTTKDYAISMDGSSQYATVAGDLGTQISDTFTISFWVKPNSRCSSDCTIFSKYGVVEIKIANAAAVNSLTPFTVDSFTTAVQTYQYRIDGNGGNGSGSPSPTWGWIDTKVPVDFGMWSHIALIKSAGGAASGLTYLYVNGNLAFTGNAYNCASGCTSTVSNVNSYLTIGASFDGTTRSNYFPGQVDQVEIWNSARTGTNALTDATTYETNTVGLQSIYDFNEGSGTLAHNMSAYADSTSDLNLYSAAMWTSVDSTTITNGVALTLIPRTILNSVGGWAMPTVKSNVLVLAIGGGGGGGTDAGSGGAGGTLVYDTTTIVAGTIITAVIGQGGLPNVYGGLFGKPATGTAGQATSITWNGSLKYQASGGALSNYSYGNCCGYPAGVTTHTGGSGALAGGNAGSDSSGNSTTANKGGDGPQFYVTGTPIKYAGGGGGGGCFGSGDPTFVGAGGGGGGGGSGAAFYTSKGASWGQAGAANSGGGGGGGHACDSYAAGTTANGLTQRTPGGDGGTGAFYLRYIPALNTFTAPASDTTTAGLTDTFTVTGTPFTGMTRGYQWQIETTTGRAWVNAATINSVALNPAIACSNNGFSYMTTSGSYVLARFYLGGSGSAGSTSSCNFTTPFGIGNVDALIVGGGGGGGNDDGGGGGGGQVISGTFTPTYGNTEIVTVGHGGAPGTGTFTYKNDGNTGGYTGASSWIFGDVSLTALGGDGAIGRIPNTTNSSWSNTSASGWTYTGWTGGGGGDAVANPTAGLGGASFAGGAGAGTAGVSDGGSGGGGGAGGPGAAASGNNGGSGGTGVYSSITGTSLCYGGGGGGAGTNGTYAANSANSCGGGNAGTGAGGNNWGTDLRGGGGGGASNGANTTNPGSNGDTRGGYGGNGVVYLRYLTPISYGVNSATYVMPILTTQYSGLQLRCLIIDTDTVGLVATDSTTAATLTVNPAIAGSIESATVLTSFGTPNIFDTATAQYGTGALAYSFAVTPSPNGHIRFDTNTSSVLIDTNTLVGTYYETLTVTDIKGATAVFYETTTVSRGVRTGFAIGPTPNGYLTGILTETNTLYITNATPIAPYYAMYDTVTATYSLVTGSSSPQCSLSGSKIYAGGIAPVSCSVTVTVPQSANYLAAQDTATFVFTPLVSIYGIQYNAGAHQFQLANGPTPVAKQDTTTASDSSTTNTAPVILGFTVSGNDTTGVTITVTGKGFWSPLSNDQAAIDGRPIYPVISVTVSSVTTNANPQVIVISLPAGWCASNSISIGTDVGPITIETPAGTAMSLFDFISQ